MGPYMYDRLLSYFCILRGARDVTTTIFWDRANSTAFIDFTDVGFRCTPTENCWQVFARRVNLLCLLRLFFCPWKSKRKRPGKTPCRFTRTGCNSLSQTGLFQPCRTAPQAERLEVVVF